jgi:hypothetical protein
MISVNMTGSHAEACDPEWKHAEPFKILSMYEKRDGVLQYRSRHTGTEIVWEPKPPIIGKMLPGNYVWTVKGKPCDNVTLSPGIGDFGSPTW